MMKTENERLRELLQKSLDYFTESGLPEDLAAEYRAALSQQDEPAPVQFCDDVAHDDWRRDGFPCPACTKKPAPAQDEREAFEAWLPRPWSRDARLDGDGDLVYAEDWVQGAWIGWQAALATRHAQAEQQPERWFAACGDWRETGVAIHGERSGYIACGIPEDKAHAIIKTHNAGLSDKCATLTAQDHLTPPKHTACRRESPKETTMQTDFGQINTFDFRTDEQRNAPLILINDSNCDHICDECELMACECEAA